MPFPTPGDLPDPGIKPISPALPGGSFTTNATKSNPDTQFPESMLLLQGREALPLSHTEHLYHLSTQQEARNDFLLNQ